MFHIKSFHRLFTGAMWFAVSGFALSPMLTVEDARAADGVVYFNDFESGDTSGWSTSTPPGPWSAPIQIEMTPFGTRRFLGQFGKQTVRLTLSSLAPHTNVTVSFDLNIINTWDGNYIGSDPSGPDIWELTVAGGPTLLHTTFGLWPGFTSTAGQAYPGSYPGSAYPFGTGAAERGTLGYSVDAVYKLSFTFPHADSALQLDFTGNMDQPPWAYTISDESWGLDSVKVDVSTDVIVPTVSEWGLIAMTLLGLTAGALMFARRRVANA